jgi:phage host-nuclease inhibitor protein Gam
VSDETTLAPSEPEYVDEVDQEVRPGWRIDTLATADWCLSRVADLEKEIEENEAIAADAIRRVEERTKQLNAKAMRGATFFRQRLVEFAQANREQLLKGGKKKTRELQHGCISWRKRGGGLVVVDRDQLLAWAQRQPVELGLTRVKEEPEVATIKAYAARTNTIPPGMTDAPEEEDLHIRVTEESNGLAK